MRHTASINIIIVLCIELCTLVASMPLEADSNREAAQGMQDDFGFPVEAADKIMEERPSNSCYVDVEVIGKMTRQCCEGYTGTECNILFDPFRASDPCNNQTCPNNPEAQCAVIRQCGRDVAVFLNVLGQIIDCSVNKTDEQSNTTDTPATATATATADTNISTLSCQGFCDFDPCKNQTCPSFPDAFCFQSGCACEPVWILDTGVQVNCTSGTHMDPLLSRRRRQATTIPSSCSS